MVVIVLIAVGTGLMTLALRDSADRHLEEEGVRLAALLESARAQSRIAGTDVTWAPSAGIEPGFRFAGLADGATQALPHRWLDDGTTAEIVGAARIVHGPEPLLPPQRIVLHLGERQVALGTDGLGPFAILPPADAGAAPR